jgi:nucleoside-diphosphate-sugar epimerase
MLKDTILIGPTGFLGPAFLESDPSIAGVGRSKLPSHLKNDFIHIDGGLDFSCLDNVEFKNVIFLIGSSDHGILNNHPTLAIEKNVFCLSVFLDYLKKNNRKVNKIINFTTMLQYDSKKLVLPCDENNPRDPYVNNYVMSKFISEMVTERYREYFSIIDVRISNVYGPTRLERPDLVPTLIWKALGADAGTRLTVWNKNPRRDFIFVEDAITAVLALLETDYSGPVNLGSGVSHSVGDVCSVIEKLSNKIFYDENIPVTGHMEYVHDISLLQSLINWQPSVSLEEGLVKTFREMQDYPVPIKK